MLLVWERMRDVLPEIRQKYKTRTCGRISKPSAISTPAYFQGRSGEGYEAFLKRINGIGTVSSYQLSVQATRHFELVTGN